MARSPAKLPAKILQADASPLIRCPGCRTFVPIEPHVQLVGDVPLLDCPVCRGARDLSFDRALN